MAATYKDIQRITGLSLATISKYYNGGTVLEHNRVAIESAANDLGFRVNEFARSLRSGRSQTVGVLLPELNNDFHLNIIVGVEAALRDSGVGVVVCSSRQGGSGGDAVDFLIGRRVDGIIAVPSAHDASALADAAGRGLPLVVVDRMIDGLECDAVVLDNARASADVVDHLVQHGHHDIALICGTNDVWTMQQRRSGFRAAMRRARRRMPRHMTVTGPLTVEAGYRGMQRLLAAENPPTAVYCANYELTVGALIAVNESGVSVPADLSFVGFDSLELARASKPRLSMLVQPVRDIAAAAATLVNARFGGRDGRPPLPPQTVVLPGKLVPGESVASPRHSAHPVPLEGQPC
ncbi:MAG TPA: LacI family DNA-binding transcriptional regulator [Actinomycetales bacterium]|nr:LacI family DNA-binding transcriptional regulator [Actinomycetales bacterium]